MGLMAFIKFGYALVLVTLLLMIWASLSRALDIHVDTGHPPCQFQALCTCSKPGGDLGIVTCNYAPIARVPPAINSSKVYVLQLQGNRIRELEPQFFQSTGLYKLAINENPIEMIHDEAFYGLDNTLWELELRRDELTEVPSRALRYLQKLRILDLTGNQISEVTGDNWRGLENTLQTLILADNSITSLPLDVFSGLPMLEVLDLSGNHLALIDNGVFRDGMNRLKELYLQDNQLIYIPYEQVAPLRLLRVLDLSKNVIKQVPPAHELNSLKLNLDSLLLNDNVIRSLLPGAFKYFNMLNHTSLDGNPIYDLREDAFRNAKIKSLSLRDCGLLELSPAAFAGLENSLTTLDLSQNNLTALSKFMLNKLDALRSLNLKENKVDVNYLSLGSPSDYSGPTYNSFQYKLFFLDISGAASLEMTMQDVRKMRSLRYLSVGKLLRKSLRAEDFLEFGVELEDLKITGSTINSIETSAFEHVRTIKTLDLSENNIEFIDPFAFAELHSLTTLKMANGLHEYVKILPFEPLKALIDLQYLDLSNNKLKNVPDTSFHFLYKLKTLNLQDNLIHHFAKGTLQGDIHKQLEYISLSLNQLRLLEQHTFVDLKEIKEILIEDNFIEMIYRRAFTGLDNLKVIRLKGNKIIEISEEAFQTLPALQELDISFNRLETFRFSIFDQVGSATALKVNASYNYIYALTDSIAPSYYANSLYYQPKTAGFFYDETRPYGQSGFLQQRPYDPRDPNFQRPYVNGEQRVFPTTDYERQRELGIRPEYDPRRPNDPLRPDYDPRRPDYDPRRPDYDPRRPDYDPRRTDYDQRRADYDPLRPELNQRRPEYDPTRPEYDPTRPEYDPSRPEYDPRRPDRPLNGYGARPYQQGLSTVSVNIRVLDFSHNNITYIAPYYFRHADLTLSELRLSHNLIRNVSRDVFGSMTWLQYLDLSYNQVFDLEYDCFKRARNLQFIDLSHNFITELPLEIFREMLSLTVVDLSDNYIRNLPDNLIPSPALERLDLSNNKLSRVPTNMLSPAAAHNLVELDLSRNTIPAISMADFVLRYRNGESTGEYWVDEPDYSDEYMYHTARRDHQRVYHQKKQYPQNILYKSLAYLNLRDNHLVRIEPGTFTALPRLKWLDLSNNSPFNVEKGNMIFRGLERRLLHLGMRNVSLTFMPSLPLPRLKSLDLSSNNLPSLAPDTTANLTRLTSLDLSFNDLTAVPVAAHTCNELRWLSLSGNPITAFMNTSLYGLSPKLEYLDVTNLRVRMLEHGVFNKMFALRTLKITAYTNAREFNLAKMLTNNAALKNLYIDVEDPSTNMGRELSGSLPCKLNNITFTGKALKFISEYILSGVHSRQLRLTIYNTSVETIDSAVFWNPGRVRNITLDLRSNSLYRVPNPGQREWPGVPNSVFLQDIILAGNPLECDCGIGWVEAWDRKRRQYLCPSAWECVTTRDDIRFARCPSYYNRTLIDVLSRDLECGFSSGYLSLPNILMVIQMAAIAIFYS